MKKKLLIIIPIVVILAAAAAALTLLHKQHPKVQITYDDKAFGEYFQSHLFPIGHDPQCKHFLAYRYVDKYTHVQECIAQKGRPWGCDFEPVYSPHEYEFVGISDTTCNDYGHIYHILNIKCSVCRVAQYTPYVRCKLDSPTCDGSCLGLSVGDHVEVGE